MVYQPQLETFQGDHVTGRAAVSVQKTGWKAPVFGVAWGDSRVVTDPARRMVEFQDIKISKLKFPEMSPEQERQLAAVLDQQIAAVPKPTIALDQLLAALADVEKAKADANFNNTPPKILFMTSPAVLVLIDGQPILREVAGFPVQRVVNTPFVLLFDSADNQYYLTGEALWFAAPDIKGPWQTLEAPPAPVVGAARHIAEAEVPTQVQPATLKAGVVPRVVVATDPTELIVADGAPQFAPLEGTDLLYLSNTGRDVFEVVGTQQYYVLLSGRWFTTPSLEEGPWAYVPPDKLPAGFYRIPPSSVKGHILAFVPDTLQAREAVAQAQVPVIGAMSRQAAIQISYDGAPRFEPIAGTTLECAVNTNKPVIKARNRYYTVDRAVWYYSDRPAGRYLVADWVPPEIYLIPPSSPLYYVTHVRVYGATPSVVYCGYTSGYVGTYVTGGTIVYGTGYVYRPYIAPAVYYPAPVTYGYAPIYVPGYRAWNFLAGATFGFIAGAATSNWWGGCCGWHGNTYIDINRNISLSRDYVQHLYAGQTSLPNFNLGRQGVRSLGASRQDVRTNLYQNPNWSRQIESARRDQLNQRYGRLAGSQRARIDGMQNQRMLTGGSRSSPAAPLSRASGAPGRFEQRQSLRQAPSLQHHQATSAGGRAGTLARQPSSVGAREARAKQRVRPTESDHYHARARGIEKTPYGQQTGRSGFSSNRGGGGGFHGGGRQSPSSSKGGGGGFHGGGGQSPSSSKGGGGGFHGGGGQSPKSK
ncbi:MAG: hypothetical protein V7849_08990 [Candidatus Competibacter sp.]